jgi:hypothetical protein
MEDESSVYSFSQVQDIIREFLFQIDLCFDDGELSDTERFENVLDDMQSEWGI